MHNFLLLEKHPNFWNWVEEKRVREKGSKRRGNEE
jgi:hypothetical protein